MYHPKALKLEPRHSLVQKRHLPVPLREETTYRAGEYQGAEVQVVRGRLRIDFVRESDADLQYPEEPRRKKKLPYEAAVCHFVLPGPTKLILRQDQFERE
jgi:hypothetical protein